MSTQQSARPEFNIGKPVWHHHHSRKFHVISPTQEPLELGASAANVVISPDSSKGWIIKYRITHAFGGFGVDGKIYMTTNELEVAFDLHGRLDDSFVWPSSQWLINRYGGDFAAQGSFIRYHRFLNIPGPGTGHDGDANVSIELNDEIKAAVKALIEKFKQ